MEEQDDTSSPDARGETQIFIKSSPRRIKNKKSSGRISLCDKGRGLLSPMHRRLQHNGIVKQGTFGYKYAHRNAVCFKAVPEESITSNNRDDSKSK